MRTFAAGALTRAHQVGQKAGPHGQGLHPLFSLSFEEEEQQLLRLVKSIKQYHSQVTILEINASNQDLNRHMMQAKRQKDCKAITCF